MRSIQDLTSIYDTYCSGVRCFPTKLNLVCHKESKLIILTRSENHRQKQHSYWLVSKKSLAATYHFIDVILKRDNFFLRFLQFKVTVKVLFFFWLTNTYTCITFDTCMSQYLPNSKQKSLPDTIFTIYMYVHVIMLMQYDERTTFNTWRIIYFCTVDRTNPNSSVKDIHVT